MHWSKRDYVEPDGYQIAVQKIFSSMPPSLIFIVTIVALQQIFKSSS